MKTVLDLPPRIRELREIVKEFTSDDIVIMAIPGEITHKGKLVPAVDIVIGDNRTKKTYRYMYRGLVGNFRDWLKKKVDFIKHQ